MNSEQTNGSGFPFKVLSWFCPEHLYEELVGDLTQRFERDVKNVGRQKAKRRLWWSVIKFFRPEIILRNKFLMRFNQSYMFSSYLKIMRRNLIRQKFYSAINVIGLTVGITFALLIGVFIYGELQVNNDLKDVERLYLLENKYTGSLDNYAYFSPAGLSKQALSDYPSLFEDHYRFWDRNVTVSKDDKHFRVQTMLGDSTFLQMFGFPVLYGNASTALTQPYSAVISEKIARQYFDRADVIGESMLLKTEIGGSQEFIIKAVLADLQPKNAVSDFRGSDAQLFVPIENGNLFIQDDPNAWSTDIITYLKLRPNITREDATSALNKLMKGNLPADVSSRRSVQLDPLSDYYLDTDGAAIAKLVYSLATIVLFVLLLAVANFINITIAGSFSRLKEVGVRKVIGGVRRQVIVQFVSESVVLALCSGIVSMICYEILRGYFGDVLSTHLPSLINLGTSFWIWIVPGIVMIGLIAGAYPSVYLSATGTIDSLKGKFKSVKNTIQFSKGLIAAQFLIAIFIFIVALIMSDQISFFLSKDLGYDKSFVLDVSSAPRLWTPEGFDKIEASKKEFLTVPEIKAVSISWGAPNGSMTPRDFRIYHPGQTPDEGVLTPIGSADEDYARVYGMTMIDGKFLFEEGGTFISRAVVINESAQKKLNVKVGDKVKIQFFSDGDFTIAGIVKDFNYETLHQAIKPVAFLHNRDFSAFRHFSFKVASGNLAASVQAVENRWKQIFPDDPFVYDFQDVLLKKRYNAELQLKKAASIASVLILIIVLIGILGLVSLSVQKRIKEIGIRKVLGATVQNILVLISREYAIVMIVSFVIGIPLAFAFVSNWLNAFAYHIELEWWMFLLPVLLLFFVTLLTVAGQSLKAALSNPVKSIKYE